ncbi:MAG: helix-turn-helix transcriptional regulator [Spirochaetes bacterium]|nr:helix-turn-helix transcriptional regulator [Spirochaetota bacterium]
MDDTAVGTGINPMDKTSFARVRTLLGKSQKALADLLGVSLKAVESYEQGWRNVPSNVERMLYFLLFKLNQDAFTSEAPCWVRTSCSEETRRGCVAHVTGEGHFCWFFTGGLCASARASGEGERHCYQCVAFTRLKSLVEEAAAGAGAAGEAARAGSSKSQVER